MGLLNYTTEIPAEKSIAEIIGMLAAARAQAITQHFDGARNCIGIEQVMLPYAIMPSTGKSFFETLQENKFERLALPAPKEAR